MYAERGLTQSALRLWETGDMAGSGERSDGTPGQRLAGPHMLLGDRGGGLWDAGRQIKGGLRPPNNQSETAEGQMGGFRVKSLP